VKRTKLKFGTVAWEEGERIRAERIAKAERVVLRAAERWHRSMRPRPSFEDRLLAVPLLLSAVERLQKARAGK